MTPDFSTPMFAILTLAGFLIGILSVVTGGGMFFSVPLLQFLFPGASFGVLLGSIKAGSFFRSIGSTISTHRQIEYRQNFRLAAVAFAGSFLGASLIAGLDQRWIFPAVLAAVLLSFYAPKVAHKITPRTYNAAAALTGIYAGMFGAGIGILLIALLRLKHPADTDIGFVKIQARFVEWLLVITSIAAHIIHGNMVAAIWVPWALGSIAGGYAGGVALKKMGSLSGRSQKAVLAVSCGVALLVAGFKFFGF